MGRIVVFSASMGGGHDGVAQRLAVGLETGGHAVTRHDVLAMLPGRLGWGLRAAYRRQLAMASTSWGALLRVVAWRWVRAALVLLLTALAGRRMLRAIPAEAAVVVSTYPLASQVLARLRRRGKVTAAVVTYLTDPSVHPLWIAAGTDVYLAPYAATAGQARRAGARTVVVVAAAVDHRFRPARDAEERASARAVFGLPATGALALVVSGSWGVGAIERVARDVAATGAALPVVVCGDNTALQERLQNLDRGTVLGWVADMATLQRACDVMVCCSGGLSVAEAHATGMPVITYRALSGHGRANARVLHDAGLANWVGDSGGLAPALHTAITLSAGVAAAGVAADPVGVVGLLAAGPLPRVRDTWPDAVLGIVPSRVWPRLPWPPGPMPDEFGAAANCSFATAADPVITGGSR